MAIPGEDDAHHVESSGEDLTPPPHSSPEPASPSAQVAHDFAAHQNQRGRHAASAPSSSSSSSHVVTAAATLQLGLPEGSDQPEKPPRKKPGRKPGWARLQRELAAAANGEVLPEPKRRQPRKPKDPEALVRSRKRKTDSLDAPVPQPILPSGHMRAELHPRPDFRAPSSHMSEMGNHEAIPRPIHSFFAPAPPPTQPQGQPRVRSSGQNYDPIRSNYDPVRETVVTHSNPFSNNAQGSPRAVPPPPINRASASPSISSLVDPPNQALTSPSIAAQSFFNQQQQQARYREEGHNSLPASPQANRLTSVLIESTSPGPSTTIAPAPAAAPAPVAAPKKAEPAPKKPEPVVPLSGAHSIAKKVTTSTATSSTAASPKPSKPKEPKDLFPAPPPLPGSGLMQLGGSGSGDGSEFRAPTVILTIPMNGEVNKYVNFTRLAEEQYGWDALHPRLAAQRDRLARVAAAGAALERNGSKDSGDDDMSLDSEAEGEGSNVEMGGVSDGGRTGTDGGAKKVPRKRKMKEDEYDKDDGFVDDSELLWEEQAAAANDGFFVYSGPLVPEGEKPVTESRADGAPKRGRGGGRGSRGGKMGPAAARGAANPRPGREGLPASGPGSRGGSITRKPRITKADRARMEQEKVDRERMGAAAMQPNGYGGVGLGSNLGNTPMVFNQT